MSDLPPGWEWVELGEVAETSLGKMLDKGRATNQHLVPYLRNVNVQWGKFDLSDVATMDVPSDMRAAYELKAGDLLVCEGGEIGRCAIWPGSTSYMAYQKALHRVRPARGVEVRYLRYLLEYLSLSNKLLPYSSGSTIKHLPQRQLRRLPLPLPPTAEQRRIVATLEDHLSRLDAGRDQVKAASSRLRALTKRVIVEALPVPGPAHWRCVTVGQAGHVELGRQRHPDWHTGPHMRPYLRVANVFENRLDFGDVKEMSFPPEVFERFKLYPGDILLNEGQSPEYLGRPAMYRGTQDEFAFTNSLLRFKANSDVLPEWALLVFRRHMHARRFVREVRITTNIAHLSAARFKSVEFPIPPLAEQERIVTETGELLRDIARLSESLDIARRRAGQLRHALLADAFAGALVPQDPTEEPAGVLLERVRAERAAQSKRARARQAGNKTQEALL
ncbi:restriction endonuclease subunit S [Actinosynnema sp. NPDC053489]|uniref:restriction endonuclease subunit S n=1 Tax=Actinosynnema sp. NPDC053489 TaxID=3363916 RepID=UPI0037C53927